MNLCEAGYQNLIELFDKDFGVDISKKYIDENFETLKESIHDFVMEAESGGIFDTIVRDQIGDFIACKYTSFDHWPLYGEGEEYFQKFQKELEENCGELDYES